MEVNFSIGPKEDIKQSAKYYEDAVIGLGKAFLEIIEEAVENIIQYPKSSGIIKKPYRRYLIKRFPFGVIYTEDIYAIFIVAVMHLKRKPYYWLEKDEYSKL